MTTRWLAGLAIFALGFGCAHMMRVTTAEASGDEVLDEGLQFIEHDDKFELINTGTHRYLLAVKRKDGTTVSEPAIRSETGSAIFSKEDLESLTVIRLVALAELTNAHPPQRDCRPDFENCFGPETLMPPLPPKKTFTELVPF